MLKRLALVMLAISIFAVPGILLAANQIQTGWAVQPLIATILILAGFFVPFAVPRK